MTNPIAKDRLHRRFAKWDVNGSGTLERSDFQAEASRIVQAFGKQGSPQGRALEHAMVDLFDYHAAEAGVPPQGSVNEEQFIDINERLMFSEGESNFNRVLRPVMEALVGLCDNNADGMIDQQEFVQWLAGVGVGQPEAIEAFRQIDTNGDGALSTDELLAAVRAFHYGKLDVPLLG
jgi:Ca2+-binding EF-hand superfamily protein